MTAAATKVELVGDPSADRYATGQTYARNVWDMQAFEGRVYLGFGNSSNIGPAPNAGPVDVWSYDPDSGRFSREFVVDEEQIDRYRVVGGELLIPGHDPRESWDWGNFYRLRAHQWQKRRTIPKAIHCYDLLDFQEELFAAISSTEGAAVTRSTDGGNTWTSYLLSAGSSGLRPNRAVTLFVLGGRLYVWSYLGISYQGNDPPPGVVKGQIIPANPRLDVWNGSGFEAVDEELFPGTRVARINQLVRPVVFQDQLVYIGAYLTNDHQWRPGGLFSARGVTAGRLHRLEPGELPYDLLIHEGACYVLTNQPEGDQFMVRILASTDLARWRPVASFRQPTFARSFEALGEDFYIGLGCDTSRLAPETGSILRIRGTDLEVAAAGDQ